MAESVGRITIPVKALDDYWRLYVLSDVHTGNKGCHLGAFRRNVETIAADENCGVILLGDQIDAIAPGDPRFDPTTLDERSLNLADLGSIGDALYDGFADLIEPLRGKVIGAVVGNHEHTLMVRHHQMRLHGNFCVKVGARNLGMSGFLDLVFKAKGGKSVKVRIFYHHGSGAAQTPGGKINRLVKFMDMADSDVTLVGHTHEQLEYNRTRLTANPLCTKIGHVDQFGVVCGSYLRAYKQGVTGYAERAGYHPTSLGSPCIDIVPATRTMGVTWLRG